MANVPEVSIVVPARNEEVCLSRCLESLVAQSGVEFELLVVDDHSTDRTGEIARSFPRVRLLEAGPLPVGWSGKCNAVVCGEKEARGEWLLFTDADTAHAPGSLAAALNEAKEWGADLLSYSPEQEVHGWLEKAVMVVIFAELATRYPPPDVSDPRSPVAAANGQYLLVRRGAYDRVGGHAKIAGSLLEDVALARAIKSSGGKLRFRLGRGMVRTRMYQNMSDLLEGWSKNLALLFRNPIWLAVRRLCEFLLIPATAALAILGFSEGVMGLGWAALGGFGLITVMFLRRIGRAHFPWGANLLAWSGLPIFSYLLLRSVISYKRGRVAWKGRSYSGAAELF